MSSKILTKYINTLDISKHFFTKNDIKNFEQIRYKIDNSLLKGDLAHGYIIFNLFLKRSFERFVYIITVLEDWEQKLNFTKNENISLTSEGKPWPKNKNELTRLWKKELKNNILNLKFQKKDNKEISKILKKRYWNRLKRLCKINSKDAFRIYMNAVTTSFDPHSQYFSQSVSDNFDIQMSLSLEGIGVVLQNEFEYTKVVRIIPKGPADKTKKLNPGDKIIGVGQNIKEEIQDIVGWRIDEVVKLIRGPKNTFVRLKIIPANKKGNHDPQIIIIKRDIIKLEEQAAQKKIVEISANKHTYKIGIIHIPTFYRDFKALQNGKKDYKSTTQDVLTILKELKQENINGLIIDLRNNSGGALKEANQLTGLFIKSGPTVQIKSRSGRIAQLNDPDPTIAYNGPLIVMINRMSASASEIFAGAIKDYNRGLIIGTQSFGKGTVQILKTLSRGKLKLTNAKFYRVSGRSTQHQGILPDIEYPYIYNKKVTGESSLKDALLWDMSKQAYFKPYKNFSSILKILKEKHIKRKKQSIGLKYLSERYQLALKTYELKKLSLNEKKRKKQIHSFDKIKINIKNKLLISKELKPINNIKDIDADKIEDDFLLKETEFIMVDFIELIKNKNYHW